MTLLILNNLQGVEWDWPTTLAFIRRGTRELSTSLHTCQGKHTRTQPSPIIKLIMVLEFWLLET